MRIYAIRQLTLGIFADLHQQIMEFTPYLFILETINRTPRINDKRHGLNKNKHLTITTYVHALFETFDTW